jgi:FkbM family methyltransferase
MVAVDIGAHVGYFSLLIARLVGNAGRVIAFEAHPDNAAILERSARLNDYSQVTVISKAAAESPGSMRLYTSLERGRHSLYPNPDLPSGVQLIEAAPVWEELRRLGVRQVDFVKADVEGAEVVALKSMRGYLNPRTTMLVAEHNPERSRASG